MSQNEIAKCKCGEIHLGFDQIVPSIDRTRVFCPCGRCGPWSSNKTEAIQSWNDDQQAWILCSARMPTEEDGRSKHGEVLWLYNSGMGRIWRETWAWHWVPADNVVQTAWMPLPPDPEEDLVSMDEAVDKAVRSLDIPGFDESDVISQDDVDGMARESRLNKIQSGFINETHWPRADVGLLLSEIARLKPEED